MHIKEVELQNFKSFGRRVNIPFFDDFTIISGPNGSGKSNIVDAILFALGLFSSRIMRAEKLTDLIYNGNGEKRDFAKVTIRFDNRDRELPLDSDEIVITRKVRQTESGYYSYFYFNEKPASLADVHNYLSKAKITPEGYNVVIQGEVTRIIEMTPLERRRIIDEISGINEFEAKKEQALNELEIVRQRIERGDIILGEVEEQIKKLLVERDHALKYQALRDEKRKYEGYVFLAKLKDAEKELKSIAGEIEGAEIEKKEVAKEVEEKREEIRKREDDLVRLNSLIAKKGEDEQIRVKKEVEEIRGGISRCMNTIELSEKEISNLEARQRKALIEIDNSQEKIRELTGRIQEENLRRETLMNETRESEAQLNKLKEKIEDVDVAYAGLRDNLAQLKNRLEEAKNTKNELLREGDRLLDALRRKSQESQDLELEIQDAQAKISSADADTKKVKAEIEDLNKKINSLTKDIDDLEGARSREKKALSEIEDSLRNCQLEYAKAEARVKAASELEYSGPVESILRAKKNRVLPGIYGTIAELGKVDEKYATALEIAAGARMQSIVVATDEDASRAIDYLKQQKIGRATFLPLNKMEAKSFQKNLPKAEGVIDYAINLIEYDKRFEQTFRYVFLDTLVVDCLDNARRLMGGRRIVTLEGELIERGGAMSGGTFRSRLSFASMEEKRLSRLAEQLTEYEGKRTKTLSKLDTIEGEIASAKKEIASLDSEITKKQMVIEEIASRGTRLGELIAIKQKQLGEIEKSRLIIRDGMNLMEEKKKEVESSIAKLSAEIARLEEKLRGSEIPELSVDAARIQEEISRLGERVRDIEAGINALELEKKYAENKVEEARDRLSELDKLKEEHNFRIGQQKGEIKNLEEASEEKKNRERILETELQDLQKKRTEVQREHSSWRENIVAWERRLEGVERKMLALGATRDALLEQTKELRGEIQEHGIQGEEVPSTEAVIARITSIIHAMEKMEPVNMLAIEEYNEVERRYLELKKKRDTLFLEREEILSRIKQWEHLKKQAFMETFNGINEEFKKVFAELSDGTGELILENPEDPFQGGMTIKAQPSEKNLQRLEAMSGGEKSLTALSLLFAIQQYKPAPFYAFDEIDIFLDSMNVDRIAKKIQESAKNAQFIVVSLRKPMIEAANRTIGVAMQENNLSSITGIKLN